MQMTAEVDATGTKVENKSEEKYRHARIHGFGVKWTKFKTLCRNMQNQTTKYR